MTSHKDCDGILVIEDDRDIRESLKLVLEMEGFSVKTATDGKDAIRVLEKIERPCLILLDLMMPVMNGWEFLHNLRSNCVIATTPVIVVSAVAEKAELPIISGYVKKPVDLYALLDLVRHYCPPQGSTSK